MSDPFEECLKEVSRIRIPGATFAPVNVHTIPWSPRNTYYYRGSKYDWALKVSNDFIISIAINNVTKYYKYENPIDQASKLIGCEFVLDNKLYQPEEDPEDDTDYDDLAESARLFTDVDNYWSNRKQPGHTVLTLPGGCDLILFEGTFFIRMKRDVIYQLGILKNIPTNLNRQGDI
jgi:hypothetical protein